MKVILASKNQHKLTELSAILSQLGFEIALESEYGLDIDVEETGTTFEENSFLKADAVMKASGLPVLADDSGLMVDALDGAPGVYSARYGHKASDKERTAYLLENMKDVPERNRGGRGGDGHGEQSAGAESGGARTADGENSAAGLARRARQCSGAGGDGGQRRRDTHRHAARQTVRADTAVLLCIPLRDMEIAKKSNGPGGKQTLPARPVFCQTVADFITRSKSGTGNTARR